MWVSKSGIKLIKSFEGLQLSSYLCSSEKRTIGYGATQDLEGNPIREGQVITLDEAKQLLTRDLTKFSNGVDRLITVEVSQNCFDSLVSWAFNVGLGAAENSTLMRLLNKGENLEACAQLARWNKDSTGKANLGLLRRRVAEMGLWLK